MPRRVEVLREVWRITERKDDCVYKTQYVEDRWVGVVEGCLCGQVACRPDQDPDLMWVAKSTEFDGPTTRTVIVD